MEPEKIQLESLPDPVLVVDRKGIILRANSRAEELFGYAREEMVGQSIELLIPERFRERHTGHRDGYAAAPKVRPMGRGMLAARQKSGREIPVEIMLSPDAGGLVVAVVRDVSSRRDLEQFREEYMGYLSHDIKNPLSVIALQSRLLAQQLAAHAMWEEEHSVGVIAESAAFIDRLVREMLEMAYLESEQVEVHPEATEMAPFLKMVLERTVSTSDRSRVRLDVLDMATGMIEPNRIERVVVNFVQNAIKYAPPDSPILVRLETRGTMVEVSVVDRGPGLTPEEESYVFEKYRRAPSGMKRDGLGLGLYISRKIIEAHSGRIGVEKNPERGTRFYFRVPLVPQESRKVPFTITLEPGAPEDRRAQLRGVHVLLVEDEANALSALTALLSEEGVAVTAAASGEEALRLVKSRLPDIAVLDVEMPGMSGLTLLKQLRELKGDLPAVIMSGFMSHHAGIAQARETKGTTYIGKPVDVDELIRHIGRLLPV